MKQYLDLLKSIQEKGCYKPAARPGMPGTQSLFGYQFRHNLSEGFPLLTTKKVSLKNIAVELLWFLRGDTNIKYLVDNGCNIWNGDAYNYYRKFLSSCVEPPYEILADDHTNSKMRPLTLKEFQDLIKINRKETLPKEENYTLGDCGFQYGRVWREWGEKNIPSGVLTISPEINLTQEELSNLRKEWESVCTSSRPVVIQHERENDVKIETLTRRIDQIKTLIEGLKNNPEGRRHLVTAIDPAHDQDLALYWCHAMFQFNCRPLTLEERIDYFKKFQSKKGTIDYDNRHEKFLDNFNIPKYYLDCQLYQRSADTILGVPYNIASYCLLTEIIAKICNMIPGEFIHSFGDVHIYDNHKEAVEEQLTRAPKQLPKLVFSDEFHYLCDSFKQAESNDIFDIDTFLKELKPEMFRVEGYDPYPPIKAELSTGI